jgi:hypothetical protein
MLFPYASIEKLLGKKWLGRAIKAALPAPDSD